MLAPAQKRFVGMVRIAASLLALSAAMTAPAWAAPESILIDDKGVFPESLTATASGDLIISSSAKGGVYRAAAGAAKAELWIDPKTSGMIGVFGVLADDASHTLYACSLPFGAPPDKADALSALRAFDLDSGAAKGDYPLPGGAKALCNDIAVGKDGTAYVSETRGGRVLRLKPGGAQLSEWLLDARLAGIDGIAVGGDGAVYVNTVTTGRMFRIPVAADGAAGAMVELQPSVPLGAPDGLRAIGGARFLQAENAVGRVSEVTVSGDKAIVTPLKTGEAGLTSAVLAKGTVWAVNAKFAYRSAPDLKDKDPNPFIVEPIEAPAR
jgi:streptogramin lyase